MFSRLQMALGSGTLPFYVAASDCTRTCISFCSRCLCWKQRFLLPYSAKDGWSQRFRRFSMLSRIVLDFSYWPDFPVCRTGKRRLFLDAHFSSPSPSKPIASMTTTLCQIVLGCIPSFCFCCCESQVEL